MGAEFIRERKITIEIDTNKQTYRQEFTNMKDAVEFYDHTVGCIYPGDSTDDNTEALQSAISNASAHSCSGDECQICALIAAAKKFLPGSEV